MNNKLNIYIAGSLFNEADIAQRVKERRGRGVTSSLTSWLKSSRAKAINYPKVSENVISRLRIGRLDSILWKEINFNQIRVSKLCIFPILFLVRTRKW